MHFKVFGQIILLLGCLLTTTIATRINKHEGAYENGGNTLDTSLRIYSMALVAAATKPPGTAVDQSGGKFMLHFGKKDGSLLTAEHAIPRLDDMFRGRPYRVELIFVNYEPEGKATSKTKAFNLQAEDVIKSWDRFDKKMSAFKKYVSSDRTVELSINRENALSLDGGVVSW
jgi:hypothetical protein